MTVQILHALAVSFPARLVVQTSVVWFVDATASGCTNSVKVKEGCIGGGKEHWLKL